MIDLKSKDIRRSTVEINEEPVCLNKVVSD